MSIEFLPASHAMMASAVRWRASPSFPLRRFALNGPTMGTRYSAVFYAAPHLDLGTVGAALQAAVEAIDDTMSNWKPDSALSRFNAMAPGGWMDMPADVLTVVGAALQIEQLSGGAFDIAAGDLVNAWGFGPAGKGVKPGRIASLAGARHVSAGAALEVDFVSGNLRKNAAVTLDLCGIAKGFGVDALAACLDRLGIEHYLVSIDGELRARGEKPGGAAWTVAVERPDRKQRAIALTASLAGMALATSGDYRHWADHDGAVISHTIDPAKRAPARNRLASVTVAARTCMEADAWATALMVLGEVDGPEMAARQGLQALFMARGEKGITVHSAGEGWNA